MGWVASATHPFFWPTRLRPVICLCARSHERVVCARVGRVTSTWLPCTTSKHRASKHANFCRQPFLRNANRFVPVFRACSGFFPYGPEQEFCVFRKICWTILFRGRCKCLIINVQHNLQRRNLWIAKICVPMFRAFLGYIRYFISSR